jgi:carbonic anhydrase
MLLIIGWGKTKLKDWYFLPSSLVAVLLGVLINELFFMFKPEWHLQASISDLEVGHLVKIPKIDGEAARNLLMIPTLAALGSTAVWFAGAKIALVASLETLLNIEAVDKIDPKKRLSPPNRELIAQGVGNMSAGLLSGIPMTSVIVRSSVNLNAGATSRISAILHGVLLLIGVMFAAVWLNKIPLAALAAILILTGYKLTKPSIFTKYFKRGWDQFIPFIATVVGILFTDLLIGVLIGIATSIFFLLRNSYRSPFIKSNQVQHIGDTEQFTLPNQVSFLHRQSIQEALWKVPADSKLIIDATQTEFIDKDVLDIFEDFIDGRAVAQNIQVNAPGLGKFIERPDPSAFSS